MVEKDNCLAFAWGQTPRDYERCWLRRLRPRNVTLRGLVTPSLQSGGNVKVFSLVAAPESKVGDCLWGDALLQLIKQEFEGQQDSRNRVSIEERTFVSFKVNADSVHVEVGDLNWAGRDFQPYEFSPAIISTHDAARSLQPFIRCMQWMQP